MRILVSEHVGISQDRQTHPKKFVKARGGISLDNMKNMFVVYVVALALVLPSI